MRSVSAIVSAALVVGCSPELQANERLGIKCMGYVSLSDGAVTSPSEEHYVVDRSERKLIHRDAYSGEAITIYDLTVQPRQYRGERQEDGRTNGGLNVHHYETVHISREDGSIVSSSLSTTTFPSGPSTRELRFEGQCVSESPDKREALKF